MNRPQPSTRPGVPRIGRRNFIKTGSALSAFLIVSRAGPGKGAASPNNRLNIAGVGVGGQGGGDLDQVGSENIVAVCDVDWDLWLGPAPKRPYHPAYAHFRWRGWWDFGSGGLGDMGIHNTAPVFSALKQDATHRTRAIQTKTTTPHHACQRKSQSRNHRITV